MKFQSADVTSDVRLTFWAEVINVHAGSAHVGYEEEAEI